MPGTLRKEGEGVDEQNHDAPKLPEIPSPELLENEIKRGRHRKTFIRVLKNTVFSLLVVVAVSAILTVLVLPVLQITGTSMSDTLQDGDIVIAVKSTDLETGDLIAFYYNNSILVKRVIASAGSWVDVKEDGTVYVNNSPLNEPYVTDLALGNCDITLPYQVPDGTYFVMGDHRLTSIDSRNTALGCISKDLVVGKLIFRVWPLPGFGTVN